MEVIGTFLVMLFYGFLKYFLLIQINFFNLIIFSLKKSTVCC